MKTCFAKIAVFLAGLLGSPNLTYAGTCTDETPVVSLYSLTPPVLKPNGEEFRFWRNETIFSRTYHVNGSSPAASDTNPGTEEQPFKTINHAAQILQPGERVLVHAGVYRECIRPSRGGTSPSRMIGYEAEGVVIVKGSDPVGKQWHREDVPGIYSLDLDRINFGDYDPFALENLPDEMIRSMSWARGMSGTVPATLPRGMVFQDGKRLLRTATKEEMLRTEGSHWTNREKRALFVHPIGGKDPDDLLMEITSRRACFRPMMRGLGYMEVSGFTFEQVGNCFPFPQEGAISVCSGNHFLIRNNTVREVNGIGIDIGSGLYFSAKPPEPGDGTPGWNIVRGNRVSETGVCGIAGVHANDDLIEGNVLTNNTMYPIKGLQEWAAIKTHESIGTLIRRNRIDDGRENGIWIDSGNRNSRCTQNVILNCKRGIFLEATLGEPFCFIDTNIIWNCAQGIFEHDCQYQSFVHNLLGHCVTGIMLRGKATQRMVDGKYPILGGGDTVRNNAFFECKNDIFIMSDKMAFTNSIAGNVSQKQGLRAVLDAAHQKLTLETTSELIGVADGGFPITSDFLDRKWPAGAGIPGIVPIPKGSNIEVSLPY